LRTDLGASDFCNVLLYHRGSNGASFSELESWVHPAMRANLRRTLTGLENSKAFVHFDGDRYIITRTGQQYVESNRLVEHQ